MRCPRSYAEQNYGFLGSPRAPRIAAAGDRTLVQRPAPISLPSPGSECCQGAAAPCLWSKGIFKEWSIHLPRASPVLHFPIPAGLDTRKRHKATPRGHQLPLCPGWGGLTRLETPRALHSRCRAGFICTKHSQSARATVPTAGIEPLPRTAVGQGAKRESHSFIFHPPITFPETTGGGLSPSPVP